MTNQELRIAKISKLLNNTVQERIGNNPAVTDAYERAYQDLEKNIRFEKEFNQEDKARFRVQADIERQEEILKESLRKQHFLVLKKQIEDRKKLKELENVEKLMERQRPLPGTPPEPPKFFIRENIKDQIRAKRKKIKESQKNELDMDRFFIKMAKASLDEDIKKKKSEKVQVFSELKRSWDNAVTLNNMKKKADRLKFFGTIQVNGSPKKQILRKSKSKEKEIFDQIKKKHSKSLLSALNKSEDLKADAFHTKPLKEQYKSPLKNEKKVVILENDQKDLYKIKEDNPKNSSPSKEEVLKRLEKIKLQEEKIKNSKKEIIDYLTAKAKSKL